MGDPGERDMIVDHSGIESEIKKTKLSNFALFEQSTLQNHTQLNLNTGNPLIDSATLVFAVISQLQLYQYQFKAEKLRETLIGYVNQFEMELKSKQVDVAIIIKAKYIICAMIDEVILNQDIAQEKQLIAALWSQKGLVSTFYDEAWGGEQFFNIAEGCCLEADKQWQLLELILLTLNLGFAGKFRNYPQGEQQLFMLKHTLYRAICLHKPSADKNNDNWLLGNSSNTSSPRNFYFSMKTLLISAAVVLGGVYGIFSWQLNHSIAAVLKLLS